MEEIHVPGTKKDKKVRLFALSTCMWCKKTKKFLEDSNVDFTFIFVDLLQDQDRETVLKEVERYNPKVSFPTMVVENETVVGFDEKRIRQLLGI